MADATRELALGRTVKLSDGSEIRLVYTMYSLAVIEDDFGTLLDIEKVFNMGPKAKIIRNVTKLMRLAIVDDNDRDIDLSHPDNEDELLRLIPLGQMGEVIVAVKEALEQGFQQLQGTMEAVAPTMSPATTESSSPGALSSTSGASRAAKRAKASGKRPSRK